MSISSNVVELLLLFAVCINQTRISEKHFICKYTHSIVHSYSLGQLTHWDRGQRIEDTTNIACLPGGIEGDGGGGVLPWATSTITDPKPVSWRYVVSLLRLFFKNKIYSVATILDFGVHVPNINQYYYLFFCWCCCWFWLWVGFRALVLVFGFVGFSLSRAEVLLYYFVFFISLFSSVLWSFTSRCSYNGQVVVVVVDFSRFGMFFVVATLVCWEWARRERGSGRFPIHVYVMLCNNLRRSFQSTSGSVVIGVQVLSNIVCMSEFSGGILFWV